jgi:hypothetical protein
MVRIGESSGMAPAFQRLSRTVVMPNPINPRGAGLARTTSAFAVPAEANGANAFLDILSRLPNAFGSRPTTGKVTVEAA